MTPGDWKEIENLYLALSGLSANERQRVLAESGAKEEVRREVESMLARRENLPSFLERKGLDVAAEFAPRHSPGTLAGRRIHHYEVRSFIGAGGFGEVYRARDSRLDRDVALKVLPVQFSGDAERVRRSEREAKLLAALNHPNIAAIYDLAEADDVRCLVLEFVEGETLAERLKRGPIPVAEVLEIGRQITEALEAAHEQGIVHRDLKPANVMIAANGRIKVLDFGIAKMLEPPVSAGTPTNIDSASAGVILGTASYMSPEQSRGQTVDKRTDVWAFGCVLFEMLAGRKAFDGRTVTDTIASIMTSEPDWALLPAETSSTLRWLLKRCLQKQPKDRLHDIADVRVTLQDAFAELAAVHSASLPSRRTSFVWVALLSVTILGAAIFYSTWNDQLPSARIIRFPIVLPGEQVFNRTLQTSLAISPDSESVVYRAGAALHVWRMAEAQSRILSGTGDDPLSPVFSPDGQWIAFYSPVGRYIKKIPASGGTAITLGDMRNFRGAPPAGFSWAGDYIVFAYFDQVLAVPANGGTTEVWIKLNEGEFADSPQVLPSGQILLSVAKTSGPDRWDKADIVVATRGSNERKVVFSGGAAARYVPTGHLVYAQGANLSAAPFDIQRLEVIGDAVRIVEGVLRASGPALPSGIAHFGFSDDGTLVYLPSSVSSAMTGRPRELALVDRNGGKKSIGLPSGVYEDSRLSPDGQQLVFQTSEYGGTIWVYTLSSNAPPRRLTFEGSNSAPIWSPDGRAVAFQSTREGASGIFRQAADGTAPAERLTTALPGEQHRPSSWWQNTIAFSTITTGRVSQTLSTVTVDDKKVEPVTDQPAGTQPAFSPNGKWLAYVSHVAGRYQVHVRPYPKGAKYQLSKDGGSAPVWSPTGRELFYYQSSGRLVSVPVQTEPSFAFGAAVPVPIEGTLEGLNDPLLPPTPYDVTRDGKQFLVALSPKQADAPPIQQINVVVNWLEELKQRVPVK